MGKEDPLENIHQEEFVKVQQLNLPSKHTLAFIGPDHKEGPLPAFFYFALSAEKSLTLEPINQPVKVLSNENLRIFSITLPAHGGALKEQEAMEHWGKELAAGSPFLEDFLDESCAIIDQLIKENWIDPEKIAACGLSRGGFIATHLAAREKRIQTLLAFAPITTFQDSKHFSALSDLQKEKWNLFSLTSNLTHTSIRFYIGNRDQRVGTGSCFSFVEKATEAFYQAGHRSPQVELIIRPSIGHSGHGTSVDSFTEGAEWIADRIC